MFAFEQLHTVQVEITNRCQASCPMCLRNIHGGIDNPNLILTDWTLEMFQNIFTDEVLAQISCVNFCGDFGDPIINANLIDMCQYVRDNKSDMTIILHTNGSAHNAQWWTSLAISLPKNHKVIFALDGLRDTHSLYRIGTNYDMIIRNAKAFIDTGGNATLAPAKVYTGTMVKGIATMHKSNAVPVFSDEQAVDISRMRR